MTTLARAQHERDTFRRQLQATEIAATLALTAKPQHTSRIRDAGGGTYIVRAYGLTRADGGYLVTTFRCKGQSDSVSFHSLETFKGYGNPFFATALGHIAEAQYRLLHPAEEIR